jgi:hypothetical protein
MQDSLPQGVRKLLGVLENLEKVVASSNAKEKATKESAEKSAGKHDKGKRRGTNSNGVRVPQKGETREKLHDLPEVWGRAHNSQYR